MKVISALTPPSNKAILCENEGGQKFYNGLYYFPLTGQELHGLQFLPHILDALLIIILCVLALAKTD